MVESSKLLISVIVPTFNRAHLIKDAINSVLNQAYTNFELLVIDDHSTDHTKEVVKQYEDQKVKYLVNKRTKGAQGARNTGIYDAKGEWLAFLDSDDVWKDERLSKGVEIIQNKNNTELVGIACTHVTNKYSKGMQTVSKKELLFENTIGGFSNFMCKTQIAKKIGGVDEDFEALQDWDFYIRLVEQGDIIKHHEKLVEIRRGEWDRISTNYKPKINAFTKFKKRHIEPVKSLSVHCRFNCYIFKFAAYGSYKKIYTKKFTWMILGVLIDPFFTIRTMASVIKFKFKHV